MALTEKLTFDSCAACGAMMARGAREWLWRCRQCGFQASALTPHVNASESAIDEGTRERGLETLRRQNFERVLDALVSAGLPSGGRILDVGCAHGWFVQAARTRGYDAIGLEPDEAMAHLARSQGIPVRAGFFPHALDGTEFFDAIVFNDVFEHLPRPELAMRAIRDRLTPRGLAAINLPIASGVFYRVAAALDRLGVHGPFDRMWQRDFPSPHLSYFTQPTLAALAASCDLTERWSGFLPSLESSGLWARLRYDRTARFAASAVTWLTLRAVSPMLAWMPPDIGLQIFGPASAERTHR